MSSHDHRSIRFASAKTTEELEAMVASTLTINEQHAIVLQTMANVRVLIDNWDVVANRLMNELDWTAKDIEAHTTELKSALDVEKLLGARSDQEIGAALLSIAAWCLKGHGALTEFLRHPMLSMADLATIDIGRGVESRLVEREDYVDGPSYARPMKEADLYDILDSSGSSSIH